MPQPLQCSVACLDPLFSVPVPDSDPPFGAGFIDPTYPSFSFATSSLPSMEGQNCLSTWGESSVLSETSPSTSRMCVHVCVLWIALSRFSRGSSNVLSFHGKLHAFFAVSQASTLLPPILVTSAAITLSPSRSSLSHGTASVDSVSQASTPLPPILVTNAATLSPSRSSLSHGSASIDSVFSSPESKTPARPRRRKLTLANPLSNWMGTASNVVGPRMLDSVDDVCRPPGVLCRERGFCLESHSHPVWRRDSFSCFEDPVLDRARVLRDHGWPLQVRSRSTRHHLPRMR